MTPASNSTSRERNAERTGAYDTWRMLRTTDRCLSGDHYACGGVAYDHDEHRVIACLCGHHAANDTGVTIPPPNPPDALTAHTDGLEAHLEEGKGCE